MMTTKELSIRAYDKIHDFVYEYLKERDGVPVDHDVHGQMMADIIEDLPLRN